MNILYSQRHLNYVSKNLDIIVYLLKKFILRNCNSRYAFRFVLRSKIPVKIRLIVFQITEQTELPELSTDSISRITRLSGANIKPLYH